MKNTTRVLKEANKYLIMQTILQYQPLTIEEIVRRTMVSRPTVLEVIKELQEKARLTLVSSTSIVEGGAHDVVVKDSQHSVSYR